MYGNCTPTSPGVDAFEVGSPSSKNNFNLLASFVAAKEPTNLDDAISVCQIENSLFGGDVNDFYWMRLKCFLVSCPKFV